jgi:hypothetical protein
MTSGPEIGSAIRLVAHLPAHGNTAQCRATANLYDGHRLSRSEFERTAATGRLVDRPADAFLDRDRQFRGALIAPAL